MAALADRLLSDVIDLDGIEDDDDLYVNPAYWPPAQNSARAQAARQPVNVIVINSDDEDDDDEVQIVGHVVPQPGTARFNGAGPSVPRRRDYFSPPPPPQHNAIPPVPPLPRFLHDPGHTAAPRHVAPLAHGPIRRPVPFDAGVIRPSLHAPEFGPRANINANANNGRDNGIGLGRVNAPHGAPGVREPDDAWLRDDGPPAQAPNNNGTLGRMGLGGGLLTRNGHQPAGIGGVGGLLNRVRADWNAVWDFVDNPPTNEDRMPAIEHILGHGARAMNLAFTNDGGRGRHSAIYDGGGQYAHAMGPLAGTREYEKSFTHPLPPGRGFTHDFAVPEVLSVSDSPGPSSPMKSSPRHTLACARCKDPLVMNVKGSEDEAKKRRLWALRCGHVLDGKCVEELMHPAPPLPPPTSVEEEEKKVDLKGKGKALDLASENSSPLLQKLGELCPPTSPPKTRNGKGRAVPLPAPFPMQTMEDGPSDVRSRLRPRTDSSSGSRPTAHPASLSKILNSPSTSPANSVNPLPALSSSSRTTRTRSGASFTSATLPARPGGFPRSSRPPSSSSHTTADRSRLSSRKGKGGKARTSRKGKGGKPVVEEEFEWFCPVDGCLKEHRSVKVGGEWKGDEGRGAVPLFV